MTTPIPDYAAFTRSGTFGLYPVCARLFFKLYPAGRPGSTRANVWTWYATEHMHKRWN